MMLGSYTCDLQKRPFVNADDTARATAFPMPLALIDRCLVDGRYCSASALRLFYALLFIAWNISDISGIHRPLAYDTRSLRRAAGRSRLSSSDLRDALRSLTEARFEVPNPHEPGNIVVTPLLDWQHVEGNRRVFWAFSRPVQTWCGRAGSTYAWLDLVTTSALSSVAALRLYELGAALASRTEKRLRLRLEMLRVYLEVYNDAYLGASDFRGKLLKRSIASINEHAAFILRHDPYTPHAHRFVDAEILSVTPAERKAILAVPGLQPIDRDDIRFLPLPASEAYADFCARPSAPRLPRLDQAGTDEGAPG